MTEQPNLCPICGYVLTMAQEFLGNRCISPSHWQAVGLLSSSDYYRMARMVAEKRGEPNGRASSLSPSF